MGRYDVGPAESKPSRQPQLSIGLPVYNGADYLEQSLESLLGQSFGDFEAIISDNASTDGTESICRDFAAGDSRIRYVRQRQNMGAAWNFNSVVKMASAPYFKWVSHDDVMLPRFLEVCMDAFSNAADDVVLCYPKSFLIDEKGDIIRSFDDRLDLRQPLPHQRLREFLDTYEMGNLVFGVFRTDMLRRTCLLQPYRGADQVLLAEMALLGKFWELDQRLFKRRVHGGMSLEANVTDDEVAAWFDPNDPQPIAMVRTKLYLEYSRSTLSPRLGLPLAERLRAMRELIASGGLHELRVVGGEVKRELKSRTSRALRQTPKD